MISFRLTLPEQILTPNFLGRISSLTVLNLRFQQHRSTLIYSQKLSIAHSNISQHGFGGTPHANLKVLNMSGHQTIDMTRFDRVISPLPQLRV